jgi:hypothetical protein
VEPAVAVAVDVAIEAGHAPAGALGAAVIRLIELLLGERGHEEAEPLDLLGIEDPVEEIEEVVDGG